MKRCSSCLIEKPLTEFNKREAAHDGLQNYCKPCASAYNTLRIHGLTQEDIADIMVEQGGVCKICSRPMSLERGPRMRNIDHCHKTGRRRGIICSSCNRNLGWLETEGIQKILDYLGVPNE